MRVIRLICSARAAMLALAAAFFAVCTPAGGAAFGQEQDVRPTARDIASLKSVGSVEISPDGALVAYTVTSRSFDEDAAPSESDTSGGWERSTQIWIVGTEGGEATQLTRGDHDARSPHFSPDGSSLAFLRSDGERTRLHIISLVGGEARALDTGELTPGQFEWAPDSASIVFSATPPLSEAEEEAKWASGGAIRYDEEWRSARLYRIDVEGGAPVAITDGGWHIVRFDLSPDGERFGAMLSVSSDPYYTFSVVRPAIISAETGEVQRWLEAEAGPHGDVAFSPDGRFIAYEKAVDSLSLMNHLVVQEVEGRGRWNAARELDPTLSGFAWDDGSRMLYAHIIDKTTSRIDELSYNGAKVKSTDFSGRVVVGGLTMDAAGETLAFESATSIQPDEVTIFRPGAGAQRVLTDTNPQVREWTLGEQRVVSWTNPEDVEIEGLLLRTPHVDADRPTPLMVMPHGGPDSVSTNRFHPWTHYFAARGLSVLRPNYRGGTGYGHAFYKANRGRLGEIEWMDIESGVDALIERGVVDPDRMVFGGWSWGGYLTAWAIGHTDRYQAAVAGAAVVDVVSQYALSDINHGVAAEWEYKGNPWEQWEQFDDANPMRRLHNATTPTLIIHGMEDDRVSFTASQILYRALKDVGCEVKMLAYPREPHGFREPAHVVHMLRAWADWYKQHLPSS